MIKIIAITLCFLLLAGCSAAGDNDSAAAVNAVSAYLQAFADKNEAQMSTLLCKDWTDEALLEYDAFQGVDTTLEGLSCTISSTDENKSLVNCQGKIMASYQNEIQEFDLGARVYQVEKTGSNWLVCGYSTP